MSLFTGLFIFYGTFFHGNLISSIFSSDEAIVAASFSYLKAYAIDLLFVSLYFCFTGYLVGRGKTLFVMIVGLVGSFLVRTPLAWLFSQIEGISLFGIGLCIPISTGMQLIIVLFYLAYLFKKDGSKL